MTTHVDSVKRTIKGDQLRKTKEKKKILRWIKNYNR